MNREAIFHNPVSNYAFPISYEKFKVRLRAGKGDLDRVTLVIGNKYLWHTRKEVPMEVEGSDELFDYYSYVYPVDDPRVAYYFLLEKGDEQWLYGDSGFAKPELVNIGHEHYVYGSAAEIAGYKAVRERGVPLKTLSIVGVNAEAPEEREDDNMATSEVILDRPVHDTGSAWYAILSFFLPIFGIIAAVLFLKHNYIRNYKMCKKGVIAFAGVLGICVALLLLFIVIAIL